MCITKLDVLDGLDTLRICVAYRKDGQELSEPPLAADVYASCEPVYVEMPGWKESTLGLRDIEQLPQAARDYLNKLEALVGVPIDIVSTGPQRDETIVLRHPFGGS